MQVIAVQNAVLQQWEAERADKSAMLLPLPLPLLNACRFC